MLMWLQRYWNRELSAEVDKVPVFFIKGKLLNTGKVIVALLSLLQEPLDGRDLVAVGIGTLDNVKFPSCSIKMGGIHNAFVDRIIVYREIVLKSLDKVLAKRRYDGFQFFKDPLMQFFIFGPVFFDAIEYLRFKVCNDESLKELEEPPFYNFNPVKPFCILFELSEKIGDGHLVGLFVELFQLHRPYFVVPPLHGSGIEDFQDKCFFDHLKYLILYTYSLPRSNSLMRLSNVSECLAYQSYLCKRKTPEGLMMKRVQ